MNDRHSTHQPIMVFISHSIVDREFARKVRNLLFFRANAQAFLTEDRSAFEKWESKLRSELSAADVVVAFLSPNSVEFSRVLYEIGAAWALRKPIILVVTRRDVSNKIPVSLEGTKVIELTDVESPENEEKFLAAFEKSFAAVHLV